MPRTVMTSVVPGVGPFLNKPEVGAITLAAVPLTCFSLRPKLCLGRNFPEAPLPVARVEAELRGGGARS